MEAGTLLEKTLKYPHISSSLQTVQLPATQIYGRVNPVPVTLIICDCNSVTERDRRLEPFENGHRWSGMNCGLKERILYNNTLLLLLLLLLTLTLRLMKVTFYSFHFVFFTVILHFLFTRYSYYFLSIKTAAYKDKLPRCLHASSFSRMNTSENNMEA